MTEATNAVSTSYVRRILTALVIFGVAIAFGQFLINAVWAFLVLYAGILFGIFLHDLSGWIARWSRVRYSWALGLVVVVLVAAAAGFFFYMGKSIFDQASQLGQQLTTTVDKLYRDTYEQLRSQEWLRQSLPEKRPTFQELMPTSGASASTVMSNVSWAFDKLMWFLGALVIIFFTGLYLAADSDRYETGIIKLVPISRRGRAREVLHKLRKALSRWIVARLISMVIIGVLTVIGLSLMKVPLAVVLGVLAALLTFVPNIGPIIAVIPQGLMALQVGPMTVLYVIIFNIVLQTVESYLVTPLVEQFEVSLPPVLTITMQVALGILVGVMGVVLAAPLEAAAMVLIQMLYIQDTLGDPVPGELVGDQTRRGA